MPGRRVALVFACGAAILGVSAAVAQDAPSEATASRSSSASPAPSLSDAEHLCYVQDRFTEPIDELFPLRLRQVILKGHPPFGSLCNDSLTPITRIHLKCSGRERSD